MFLDEIALMSPAFQGKLLRVLQEKTVIPLGTARRPCPWTSGSSRPPAANLVERIEAGEFREDLYYRLRVVTIDLPPLRERPEDIVPSGGALPGQVCGAGRGTEPVGRPGSPPARWKS